MAVWALLSISQTVKAANVTVYFQCPDDWKTSVCAYAYNSDDDRVSDWGSAPAGSEFTTSNGVKLWKCTFDSRFKYVIFKEPGTGSVKQYPTGQGFVVKDNYVYTTDPTKPTGTPLSELDKVTKVIKLFNGSSELSGSNGKYTLDLSSATTDATITLSIDDETYGLATAQTISAAGTTNVDFVANATAALTLTKGFIYSLSVTEDGKMTVVAEEKVNPVITADAGYYLVGNFFSKHNIDGGDPEDEINYSRLYFKFKDNGIVDHVHTYSMDIPASISAYMQILSVDDNNVKVVYGPGEIKAVSAATLNTNTSLTGTTLLKSSDLSKGGNYWSLTTRNDGTHDDDGMYTISFTESNGVPTNWTITHNAFKRVSYLISCAEGASAQPLYNKRGADELTSSFTDETKEYVHFDGNSQYYAISNVVFSRDYGTEQNPQPMYVAQKDVP